MQGCGVRFGLCGAAVSVAAPRCAELVDTGCAALQRHSRYLCRTVQLEINVPISPQRGLRRMPRPSSTSCPGLLRQAGAQPPGLRLRLRHSLALALQSWSCPSCPSARAGGRRSCTYCQRCCSSCFLRVSRRARRHGTQSRSSTWSRLLCPLDCRPRRCRWCYLSGWPYWLAGWCLGGLGLSWPEQKRLRRLVTVVLGDCVVVEVVAGLAAIAGMAVIAGVAVISVLTAKRRHLLNLRALSSVNRLNTTTAGFYFKPRCRRVVLPQVLR